MSKKPISGRPSASPPAVWTAFARMGRFRTWGLALSLIANILIALVAIGAFARDPDVVMVDASGKPTYISSAVAGDQLVQWLHQHAGAPTDPEVAWFVRDFLHDFLAINSTTVEDDLVDAMGMMAPRFRSDFAKALAKQNLIKVYTLAAIRSRLDYQTLQIVERKHGHIHVTAQLARTKSSLVKPKAAPVKEELKVDLVLDRVARTPHTPAGLTVGFVRVQNAPPAHGARADAEGGDHGRP